MKVVILCLVLLHCLCCPGLPLFQSDLAPIALKAIRLSLATVNRQSTGANLYGITHSSVKKVIPVGSNTYDLMLNFGIRETVCPKTSESDPETCHFRQGFSVSAASCSSRVRVSSERSEIVSLRCSRSVSSSSSSSSESNSGEVLGRLSGMNGQNSNFGIGGEGPVNTSTQKTMVDNHLDNFLE